jgi:hypothetical protein
MKATTAPMTIIRLRPENMFSIYLSITVARPRNAKNPSTSVAVVMNIVAEAAGSLCSRDIISGTIVPKIAATSKLIIIASASIYAIAAS